MEDYDYIGNYFNGSLSAEEMKRFDEKIRDDRAFAEEVAFYCSAQQEIKRRLPEEKKKRFREIYELRGQDKKNRPPVIYMNKWWKAAAAAAVIIFFAAGWWLWRPQPTQMKLVDKYIMDNLTELRVTMGNNDSLQTAVNLYNNGKLKESLPIFERLANEDSLHTTALKNAGIVYLRLKEYDKALNCFERLEKNTSLTVNPGKFYHALVLLKRDKAGDSQEADRLLRLVAEDNLGEAGNVPELIKHR